MMRPATPFSSATFAFTPRKERPYFARAIFPLGSTPSFSSVS
jgi:hypothetical protein